MQRARSDAAPNRGQGEVQARVGRNVRASQDTDSAVGCGLGSASATQPGRWMSLFKADHRRDRRMNPPEAMPSKRREGLREPEEPLSFSCHDGGLPGQQLSPRRRQYEAEHPQRGRASSLRPAGRGRIWCRSRLRDSRPRSPSLRILGPTSETRAPRVSGSRTPRPRPLPRARRRRRSRGGAAFAARAASPPRSVGGERTATSEHLQALTPLSLAPESRVKRYSSGAITEHSPSRASRRAVLALRRRGDDRAQHPRGFRQRFPRVDADDVAVASLAPPEAEMTANLATVGVRRREEQ